MMLRVKDQSGHIIPSLLKDRGGNLIVANDGEYQKYLQTKQQTETINNLTKELSELKELIDSLLSTAMINKNSTEGQ